CPDEAGSIKAGGLTPTLSIGMERGPLSEVQPALRNRDSVTGSVTRSGRVLSGCNDFARVSRTSSVSTFLGSGKQHSTGQTAWQASWSWKPTHSVHSLGSIT